VGDSGEQDPEVYGDIARRYPAQIHRILIRNVDNSEATDMRYQAAFSDIAAGKWRLFTITEEISIGDLLTHNIVNPSRH
jgi:phosphatidate phosphatase APP1